MSVRLERLRPVEPGELHPTARCAYCGNQWGLRLTLLRLTLAPAVVCENTAACCRRYYQQRRAA